MNDCCTLTTNIVSFLKQKYSKHFIKIDDLRTQYCLFMRLTLKCQRPLTYVHAQPLLNVPFCSPLIQFPINLSARATTIACQQISHIENASRAIQLTRQTLECRSFTLKWFYIINRCHLNEYKCAFKCY